MTSNKVAPTKKALARAEGFSKKSSKNGQGGSSGALDRGSPYPIPNCGYRLDEKNTLFINIFGTLRTQKS
jgi:hypothetical protein